MTDSIGEADDEKEDLLKNQGDPFSKHFENNISEFSAEQVKNIKSWTSSFQKWPELGRIKVELPSAKAEAPKLLLLADEGEGDDKPPNIAVVPKPPDKVNHKLDDYYIRKILQDRLPHANISADNKCTTSLTGLQKELLNILSNYSDLYFPRASYEYWEEVRTVYALHSLNHVLKASKKIMKHNSKIAQAKSAKKDNDSSYRDQGYSRPKVLILLPFKHSAYR